MNEVELQEKNFLIKTPETKEVIADAEAKEAEANAEVVQEKDPEEKLLDLDKEVLPDPGTPSVETPSIGTEDEEVELDAVEPAIDIPPAVEPAIDIPPTNSISTTLLKCVKEEP